MRRIGVLERFRRGRRRLGRSTGEGARRELEEVDSGVKRDAVAARMADLEDARAMSV
jgi:hypothetical protein